MNHVHQWNPNYEITRRTVTLSPLPAKGQVDFVMEEVRLDEPVRSTFRRNEKTLEIFTEKSSVMVDLAAGLAVVETSKERPLIFPLNFLHLNHAKKAWTWVADVYAAALALLALTGLFMAKGKKGIIGRAGVIGGAGLVLPVVFYYLYH